MYGAEKRLQQKVFAFAAAFFVLKSFINIYECTKSKEMAHF